LSKEIILNTKDAWMLKSYPYQPIVIKSVSRAKAVGIEDSILTVCLSAPTGSMLSVSLNQKVLISHVKKIYVAFCYLCGANVLALRCFETAQSCIKWWK